MSDHLFTSYVSPSSTASSNTFNTSLDTSIQPYMFHTHSVISSTTSSPSGSSSSDVFKFIIPNAASNMKRCLENIVLVLFRHHPNGVLEWQLPSFYHQMFNEFIVVNEPLKYMIRTHRAITITSTKEGGLLYTLNTAEITSTLRCFNPLIIKPYIVEHILRLFTLFPNGIACNCLEDTLNNISQIKLSHLIPSWIPFVSSIPFVICVIIDGLHIFVNTVNLNILPPFDVTKILTKPIGYEDLITSLLNRTNSSCESGKEFEKRFVERYHWDIYYEAPYISSILKKMQLHFTLNDCDNKSPFFEDHYSVFMGGFPRNTRIDNIQSELYAMGFMVSNCTQIKYRKYGYSWVTLSSVIEADLLIKMSPIKMMGVNIDVRPYINREKQHNMKPDDVVICKVMVDLLSDCKYINDGLSIRDIQPMLFKKVLYRISGSDLLDVVKKYEEYFYIKTDEYETERILYISQ